VPPTAGYPRPTSASPSLPFDPLAIVAIIAAFFFGPVALLMAITSIGRARKNGVSAALSVVALLVAVAMTTFQLGLGSILDNLMSVIG
jgi:threonine/homoserine/homoserine lactone efflux protein